MRARAERRYETTTTDKEFRRAEIRYGPFARIVPLPSTTTEQDVNAACKAGILEVREPMTGKPGRSRIKIARG